VSRDNARHQRQGGGKLRERQTASLGFIINKEGGEKRTGQNQKEKKTK